MTRSIWTRFGRITCHIAMTFVCGPLAHANLTPDGSSANGSAPGVLEPGGSDPIPAGPSAPDPTSEPGGSDPKSPEPSGPPPSGPPPNTPPRVEPKPPSTDATPGESQRIRVFRAGMVDAKAAFIGGRDPEALRLFEALIPTAPTPEDRRVVEEFAAVVRERISEHQRRIAPPHLRTIDELSVLYTTAFAYGFGTSAWVALQVKPESFAAALVPFIAITGASVGGVAIADNYRPFRLGVPQAISAGIYLGALEGVMLTGYQHAVATRTDSTDRLGAPTISTILWTGATAGGIIGGVLGALREPTPGQVSLSSSGGLWGGLISAFAGAAGESRSEFRAEKAFAVGAIGYNAGLIAALIAAPNLAPSVARVRLVDLGGLAGGLLGGGSYLLIADKHANAQASLGISAAGAAVGLGLAWWATSEMPEHHYPKTIATLRNLRPSVVPLKQGVVGLVEWQM